MHIPCHVDLPWPHDPWVAHMLCATIVCYDAHPCATMSATILIYVCYDAHPCATMSATILIYMCYDECYCATILIYVCYDAHPCATMSATILIYMCYDECYCATILIYMCYDECYDTHLHVLRYELCSARPLGQPIKGQPFGQCNQ